MELTALSLFDILDYALRLVERRRSAEKGSLEILPKIPVDVLYEILSYLHPLDILHLSRSTRILRELLMTRDARPVWIASFDSVPGFPSCPFDLTEPQYANLAFDEHCHFCSAPRTKNVFWACRVRCCERCIKNHFMTEAELDIWIPNDIEVTRREMIFPYIVSSKPAADKSGKLLYYLPVVESYVKELEDIVNTNDDSELDALKKWGKEKKLAQVQRLTHAALCEHWMTYWVSQPTRHEEYKLPIIVFLTVLQVLTYIWRDKMF